MTSPNVENAVVMASVFDVLWLEGEHSAITLESMRHIILVRRAALPLVAVLGGDDLAWPL